jgi:hypothetical protein
MTDALILVGALVVPFTTGLLARSIFRTALSSACVLVAWIFFLSWFERRADAMSVWNMWFIALPTAAISMFAWSFAIIWIVLRIKRHLDRRT